MGKTLVLPFIFNSFLNWLVFNPCAFQLFPAFAFSSIKPAKVIQKSNKSYKRPRQWHGTAKPGQCKTPARRKWL